MTGAMLDAAKNGYSLSNIQSWCRHTILALLFLISNQAFAQETGMVRGYGAWSCGEYKEAYDAYRPYVSPDSRVEVNSATFRYAAFQNWALGYLFGVDGWNDGKIRNFDNPSMNLWLYNFCMQHPLDIFANAIRAFYIEIGGSPPSRIETAR